MHQPRDENSTSYEAEPRPYIGPIGVPGDRRRENTKYFIPPNVNGTYNHGLTVAPREPQIFYSNVKKKSMLNSPFIEEGYIKSQLSFLCNQINVCS